VTPNQLTALTVILAVAGAFLLALGDRGLQNWGATLFVLARFLDHFDGELARLTGASSRFGYFFDYTAGAVGYCALFAGVGIGQSQGELGSWALLLGGAGAISALVSMPLNLGIDLASEGDGAVGYPRFAGFELEDGIYLIAPITWAGYLSGFLLFAGVGAVVYLFWTGRRLWYVRRGA
jgi:phosphatidylglycerophosphate synthase